MAAKRKRKRRMTPQQRRVISALLKSPEVMDLLEGYADELSKEASRGLAGTSVPIPPGEGDKYREDYPVDVQIGKNRARASVRTHSKRAVYAEATDHVLARAIGGL